MKNSFTILCMVFGAMLSSQAHEPVTRARTAIHVPDIPGYVTLKCDFHTHTVFSDGLVWPTVRAEEAWREGLDAIAITDHIEYLPHKSDVNTNHNRSFEIASDTGSDLNLMVIHGSEITRAMPPGHLNAIFLTNSTTLATQNWRDAVAAAHDQKAFIFWNHPGWDRQLINGRIQWFPEHTELLDKGMLHGIEVVNARDYYPEAHRWAIEKKLTMLSNSDIHPPLNLDYHVHQDDHRPVTLVFARERSLEAIRAALFDRRTAVYSGNRLIGDERFLKPIFERSLHVQPPEQPMKGKARLYAQITNESDIDYELESTGTVPEVTTPGRLILAARRTVLLELRGQGTDTAGMKIIDLPWKVTNLLVGPDEPLAVTIHVEVNFAKN